MAIATPLSTKGRFIVDAHGHRVRLAGVNWYGASEDSAVPAGLDQTNRDTLAGLIAAQGFNSVRLPFSVWMIGQTAKVRLELLAANRDLHDSTPLQVYDACVKALTDAGLIVIPNCHLLDFGWCCPKDDNNGLWFNDRFPPQKFTAAWQNITRRYASNPLVAAMDIKNEPRPAKVGGQVLKPAWGGGGQTDFAAMYKTVGDAIHQINPRPLIICEGLNYAGDLTGVAHHPVQLAVPNKVVYSMHDYSWSGHKGENQAAYNNHMHTKGGYLLGGNTPAPVWIGEFGDNASALTPHTGTAAPSGWRDYILAWLKDQDVDWCWWALNPRHNKSTVPGNPAVVVHQQDEVETFGLLTPDWSGVGHPAAMTALKAIM